MRFATSMIKPWGMDVDGEQQGLLIQILPYLEEETGYTITNVLRPYARVFHDLYSGKVDMAIVFDSEDTVVKAIRLGTVMHTKVVFVGEGNDTVVSSLEGLTGLSIGNLRGSKYGDGFDLAKHFRRVKVNSTKQGLAMVMRGRLDAMAAVDHSMSWTMRHMDHPPGSLKAILSIPGPVTSLYLSKNTDRPELQEIFRSALERLEQRGVLAKLYGHDHDWNGMGECRYPKGQSSGKQDLALSASSSSSYKGQPTEPCY